MSDRLDMILDLTRRLSALVEKEIDLLQARQPARLAEHEDERTRLSLLYAREFQALRDDPLAARQADRQRAEQLRMETQNFNDTLSRHQRLITRMRRISEGIVQAVAGEAQRQRAPRTTYAATGTSAQRHVAAPLAVNRKI